MELNYPELHIDILNIKQQQNLEKSCYTTSMKTQSIFVESHYIM